MTYENAPSTKLLATHCACCGRALRDAKSVERGVGPDCAEKYGYEEAQGPANWPEAVRLGLAAGLDASDLEALTAGEDAHKAANRLCYLVAAIAPEDQKAAFRLAAVIGALGYKKMGEQLTKRLAKKLEVPTVIVTAAGDLYEVQAVGLGDYFDAFVAATRGVPGRRYVPATKTNTFPRTSRRALWGALQASVPGAVLKTEKGVSVV